MRFNAYNRMDNGVDIQFLTDDSVFNPRRLQAKTKVKTDIICRTLKFQVFIILKVFSYTVKCSQILQFNTNNFFSTLIIFNTNDSFNTIRLFDYSGVISSIAHNNSFVCTHLIVSSTAIEH